LFPIFLLNAFDEKVFFSKKKEFGEKSFKNLLFSHSSWLNPRIQPLWLLPTKNIYIIIRSSLILIFRTSFLSLSLCNCIIFVQLPGLDQQLSHIHLQKLPAHYPLSRYLWSESAPLIGTHNSKWASFNFNRQFVMSFSREHTRYRWPPCTN
jgi:hypothetical protein